MGKGSFDEIGSRQASSRWFYGMIICSQCVSVIAVILIGVLFGQYRGGIGWGSDLTKVFNYHPLFMTIGMVFLYGDAILAYRVLHNVNKLYVKIIHACLLALSLIFSSVGLKAVFDSHNRAVPPGDNLFSLHSWIGLTAVVLFGLQWLCGFVTFLFPKLSEGIRQAYLPSHKFWGKVIFTLGIGAVLMGITEYCVFTKIYGDNKLKNQRNAMNIYGICVLIFGIIILYLVNDPAFQAKPETDNEHVALTHD